MNLDRSDHRNRCNAARHQAHTGSSDFVSYLRRFFQKHILRCVAAAHTVCVCVLTQCFPAFVTPRPTFCQEFVLRSLFPKLVVVNTFFGGESLLHCKHSGEMAR